MGNLEGLCELPSSKTVKLLMCASLMNSTINTRIGKREERTLMWVICPSHVAEMLQATSLTRRTGKHVVANLYCISCNGLLGWMYISAPNGHEKYKEGASTTHI